MDEQSSKQVVRQSADIRYIRYKERADIRSCSPGEDRGKGQGKLRHSRVQGIRQTNSGSWTKTAGASIRIRKGEFGRAGIY